MLRLNHTIFEQDQRWYAADPELWWGLGVGVYIELGNLQAILVLAFKLFKYGGDRRKAKDWGVWLGEKTVRPVRPDRRLVLAPVPLH